MVVWEVFSETSGPEGWDKALLACAGAHVYQSYAWGESQRDSGWSPLRLMGRSPENGTVAMAQILIKHFPGDIKIAWSPGGPALAFPQAQSPAVEETLKSLCARLEDLGGRICVRFDNHLLRDDHLSEAFGRILVRPLHELNSPYTLHLDLRQSLDVLEKGMISDARRNIKKASAHDIHWKCGNDAVLAGELLRLYDEMAAIKGAGSFGGRREKIPGICARLGKNALIFNGYIDGEAVSSCLVLLLGNKAMFRERATGRKGRELGVSHALIRHLLEHLKNIGIEHLDMGGIDPRDPSLRGVNSFKMGFGGEKVEYLGEWEWSNAQWLRRAVNLAAWLQENLWTG